MYNYTITGEYTGQKNIEHMNNNINYIRLDNIITDNNLDNISKLTNSTFETCRDNCNNSATCSNFSYNPSDSSCALFKNSNFQSLSTTANKNFSTYIKLFDKYSDNGYTVESYRKLYVNEMNEDQCKSYCVAMTQCKGISLNTNDNSCSIYAATDPTKLNAQPGVTTFLKRKELDII